MGMLFLHENRQITHVQKDKLSEGTSGHVIWGANEERSFEDKKYLYPISDIVLNPNLVQNPGW
ncbi:hypothetical protein GCM10011386_45530 [Parapedobacter defluvii]|uniref:RagB/SusD domain-containing protein n=1 Tax=Parapedobacter defluvii TaxID=2045106 RepID=A0ABQ1MZZ2_9SPHI|nr:RagB/SusD family nutrient uptake outer membrane protein [Parapedobacter defluvii]GGC48218.1 hypothetical protein GCM10011386_45530 [Parapedobacter defluvii]